MTTPDADGWHYGPDGESLPGFIEGTAFQPPEVLDHLDAWGTPHPGDLRDCQECRVASSLTSSGGGAA
ncbi:hypothetical protein [Streptomyces sp. 5-10]|uniref:hypothetical protein n=1 Tax=Streptomyces sp. 5-10 TaxID=878925 RepID=UPI00168B71D6|nr:hypothetical protein [Streptomyces sp. 5-10]MBD3004899.1 hypothetical protein [Streptomyces sp. 5-10]